MFALITSMLTVKMILHKTIARSLFFNHVPTSKCSEMLGNIFIQSTVDQSSTDMTRNLADTGVRVRVTDADMDSDMNSYKNRDVNSDTDMNSYKNRDANSDTDMNFYEKT